MNAPEKILIIRFSSIGDIVLTSPVVRAVRNKFPEAEIHFLCKNSFRNIVINNPSISRFHFYKDSIKPVIEALKKESFDCIIDLQKNARSYRIKKALHCAYFSFDKLNFKKWLLVQFKINRLPTLHIVDRYFEALQPLGIVNDGKGLDFFINPVDEVSPDSLPENFRNGYVAFVIGGTYFTKRLPNEKIIDIISRLSLPVVLLGGSNEVENGNAIRKALGSKVYNAVNKYGLSQSASVVKQSRAVITHDTGLMHIAAAFGKRIISVWGNTIPEFGMYPYYGSADAEKAKSYIAEVKELPCRPCSKLGFDACPKKHFRCMNDIDTVKLCEVAESFVEASQKTS